MEITQTQTQTQTTLPNTTVVKSSDLETETPTRIQPSKPLSFTNGVLKRHHHHPPAAITYKECLKNHAAALGGHALDGCGEFMPAPSATATDPTSLKCAACGCHRNFHRRDPVDPSPQPPPNITTTIEYQPHHRHHPPPPPHPSGQRSPNSASPPPISSSYYPSAPHMLLALSGGISAPQDTSNFNQSASPNTRKRFRTKFTQNQKEKMYEFAEKVGWKMQKRDEDLVQEFCNEIGIEKVVLKVWMHNNKNTLGKRDANGTRINTILGTTNNNGGNHIINSINKDNDENKNQRFENRDQYEAHIGTNGSSSSS